MSEPNKQARFCMGASGAFAPGLQKFSCFSLRLVAQIFEFFYHCLTNTETAVEDMKKN